MEQKNIAEKSNYIKVFNRLYKSIKNNDVEIFVYIIVKNDKIYKYSVLSIGDFDFAPIWNRQIGKLLQYNPDRVILIHNHPSGNPIPSKEDISTHSIIKNNLSNFNIETECFIYCNNNLYDIFSSETSEATKEYHSKKRIYIRSKVDFLDFTEKINYNCFISVNSQLELLDIIKINSNIKKSVIEYMKKAKYSKYFLVANDKIQKEIVYILNPFDYQMLDHKKIEE